MIKLLSVFLFFQAAVSYGVSEQDFSAIYKLLKQPQNFYSFGSFAGVNNTKVSYVKFGSEAGQKGCLVISPGRTEAGIKYLELAYDLAQLGYSPIYAIDHRGQGFSDRLLADDPQKGHVESFDDYTSDFSVFLHDIVQADRNCAGKNLQLIAHSMGGAIAVKFLESVGENNPFQKVVLTSPMLKIALPAGKTEDSVLWESWMACHLPFGPRCNDYAPGAGGAYDPSASFEKNTVTNSFTRFQFSRDLNNIWEKIRVGAPTIRWVREAVWTDLKIRESDNFSRLRMPILLLTAENELIVDPSLNEEFCSQAADCTLEKFAASKHEILMEKDEIRNPALKSIVEFLGTTDNKRSNQRRR